MGTATTDGPRYPGVRVRLSGTDGNAMMIIGRVVTALRTAGVPDTERDEFTAEAMSGGYNTVLSTAARWVDVS